MKLKLIHGDCIDEMKKLPDRSIDLFICDLPYGVLGGAVKGRENTGGTYGNCKWDIPIDLDAFWEQVERLMKDDHTPVIHFCTAKFGYELMKSKEAWFRYDLVWEKTNAVGFLNANRMPMRSHELIYVFSKKGSYYNRVDIEGDFKKAGGGRSAGQKVYGGSYVAMEPDNEGKRCVKSIITFPNIKGKNKHPTQKPADLYKWLIERYSKSGDTILDPTAGSFTSCFTAIECGRQAIGIEKDDKFYEKALSLVKE